MFVCVCVCTVMTVHAQQTAETQVPQSAAEMVVGLASYHYISILPNKTSFKHPSCKEMDFFISSYLILPGVADKREDEISEVLAVPCCSWRQGCHGNRRGR